MSSITESGVMAARCGGWCAATKSWVMPGYEMPDHADLAVRHPRLRGDGLDGVVAVERLEGLEVVARAARAAGAAHVHADGRVAEQLRDARRGLAAARVRRVVAGVLDHRGVRALVDRAGEVHVHRQQGAVAGLEVPEAGLEMLVGVERLRGDLVRAHHRDRRGPPAPDGDDVARARLHPAEQRTPGRVDPLRRDAGAVGGPGYAVPDGAPVTAIWFTLGCTANEVAAAVVVVVVAAPAAGPAGTSTAPKSSVVIVTVRSRRNTMRRYPSLRRRSRRRGTIAW